MENVENTENVESINIMTADEGKVFRRIADGKIYGKEIYLGYSYYINGVKLPEPHLDVPGDFEQIDDPNIKDSEIGGEE